MWDRRRKLKPEYQDLSGDKIRDLRLAGTEVSAKIRRPIVAYLGDSAPGGLDDNPAMYEAKMLICELTFVAPDHRKIRSTSSATCTWTTSSSAATDSRTS